MALNLCEFGYVYDWHASDNPPESKFVRGDGVYWGLLLEEARELGDITVRLSKPMGNFDEMLALQYAAPGIEWLNSRAYTWFQGEYIDYPRYARKVDDRTFVYKANGLFTCRLRFFWHECNFPCNFDELPEIEVTVESPQKTRPAYITVESGLWGKRAGAEVAGVYNGAHTAVSREGGMAWHSFEITDKQTPKNNRVNSDRTVVTLRTARGDVSFLPVDVEKQGYMAIPDFGLLLYVEPGKVPAGVRENPKTGETIRERARKAPQRTYEMTERDIGLKPVPHMKGATDVFTRYETDTVLDIPDARMAAHWKIGLSHLMAFCQELDGDRWDVRIGPYKMFGTESSPIIKTLEIYNRPEVVGGALDVFLDSASQSTPEGPFTTKEGCLNINYGIRPTDNWIPYDPGYILLALAEHYFLSRDKAWLRKAAPRVLGCVDWVFGQIDAWRNPGAQDDGLMPPVRMGDICDWGTFYVGEAITYMGAKNALRALRDAGPDMADAVQSRMGKLDDYRESIRRAYRKTLSLSPVVRRRDGTWAPGLVTKAYLRGLMCDAWPLNPSNGLRNAWLDIDHTIKLVEAGVFGAGDPETNWMLDCMEDVLALDDYLMPKKWDKIGPDPETKARDATARSTDYDPERDWYAWGGTGWQNGYCPLMQCYLTLGEPNAFIRTFYNTYALHADPETFWLREHAASLHYPPKTFEEGMFLWRLRSMLVFEMDGTLYLNRCAPETWFGEGFRVANMPTFFGKLEMTCRDGGIDIHIDKTAEPDAIVLRGPNGFETKLDPAQSDWRVRF